MRAAGNLAGVEFIAPPMYQRDGEQWREIITESGYFFTASAMRFFGSRVLWDTLTDAGGGVWLFVTSERRDTEPRRYTLHQWTKEDGTDNLGEFQAHATAAAARRALLEKLGELATS
jgi:hypothetical protein